MQVKNMEAFGDYAGSRSIAEMTLQQFYDVIEQIIVPYSKPQDYEDCFRGSIKNWLLNADIIKQERTE